MPMVDMPLDELKVFQGRNPCPEDMDLFWESSLAEMKAVNADVELIPSAFTAPFADCFDLWFTGVRGARIHAKFLRPRNRKGKAPAILQFHGYTGNCGDWVGKLPYVAAGFIVAALDCRGQGGLSEDVGGVKGNTHNGHIIRGLGDKPENMLMRHIYLDAAQLAGIDMVEVDETRVAAMGGSQGGALTIACASLEPRVSRLAPEFPFLCDYKRVWEMDLAKDAYQEIRTYFRMFDPRHEREDAIFEQLGYIDLQHLSKRIRGEVLLFIGLMDTVCPPSSQFAMYNRIVSKKQTVIYPDFGHEGLPEYEDIVFGFLSELLS
jgi:cephalosporin-C deacetylase